MKTFQYFSRISTMLFLLLASFNVYSKHQIENVQYTVQRVLESNKATYSVQVTFKGNSSGKSVIVMPDGWASAVNPDQRLVNLRVMNNGYELLPINEGHGFTVKHMPNELITVKYDIISISEDEPSTISESRYYPIVEHNYIHWIGHTTWIMPSHLSEKFKVEFEIIDFPKFWSMGSTFKSQKDKLVFNGTISEFKASIFAAGNYRKLESETKNGLITLLIQGNWSYDDSSIIDSLTEVIIAQRNFWKDKSKINFLATLIPLNSPDDSLTIDGVALNNSFAIYASENMSKDKLEYFFSHEYFHHWLPHSMGHLEKSGQEFSWFVEGFTDYYASIIRYRLGQVSYQAFIDNINDTLSDLTTFPYRKAHNDNIAMQFFNDDMASKTLYWRGFLLALKWDHQIRLIHKGKKSLDNAMRKLLSKFEANPKLKLGATIVIKQMQKSGIKNANQDVEKMLIGEKIIDQGVFDGCSDLKEKEVEVYDLGFKFKSTSTSFEFTEVDESSEAYRSGLRSHQWPMKVDFSDGKVDYLVKLKVKDGDDIKDITYRPSKRRIVPFFKMKKNFDKVLCDQSLL